MRQPNRTTRILLLFLAALLALPFTQVTETVDAKKRSRVVTRSFRTVAPMTMPIAQLAPVSASLYPSPVEVRGLKGPIRDVNVRLFGYSHQNASDVEALLVGPDGQTAIVTADIGGAAEFTDVTVRLDDEAAAPLPDDDTLTTGSYRPTNFLNQSIAFNAPAPSAGANAALSVFDGGNPNGTWRLFVQDDFAVADTGSIAGGWALEITAKAKAKSSSRKKR